MDERGARPMAVAGPAGQDRDATRHAVAWVLQQRAARGGDVLLYEPQRNSPTNDPLLDQLSRTRGVVTATWRTYSGAGVWSGGPVLAAWPDAEHLGRVDGDRRTSALCVLAWTARDVEAWVLARHPDVLGTAEFELERPTALHPVVQAGLRDLGRMLNHANNLAGLLDKRDAISVLTALHRAGYALPQDEVYAFALANDWPDRGARRLAEWAGEIDTGKRKRFNGRPALRPDILDKWLAETS